MTEAVKIKKSREILREILDIRGYNVENIPDNSEEEITKILEASEKLDHKKIDNGDPLGSNKSALCDFYVTHKTIKDWKLHVVYFNFKNVSVSHKNLKTHTDNLFITYSELDNVLILLPSDVTTSYDTYLGYVDKINMDNEKPELTSEFSEEGYSQRHLGNVQMVNINAMCINILKHELVPLHEIIRNENEIQEILYKNNAEAKSQFPVILKHDAVAEILGLVPGDLVRIYRPSITAGEAIFYRICK